MSEPPPILVRYPNPYQRQLLPITDLGTTSAAITTSTTTTPDLREYRKGNWTLEETLILITAKRLDDERRVNTAGTSNTSPATGELRWKWVENYCWNNGCLRNQNQCNDKWDNLLRDYKKVCQYEVRSDSSQPSSSVPSYWAMDRTQRKERNLPSNLSLRIYEALNDVVQKKYTPRPALVQQPLTILPPQPPPPPPSVPPPAVALSLSEASDDSETDRSEGEGDEGGSKVDQDKKRQRVRNIESSIMRSTSVLARTLKYNEKRRERQHREIMRLEEERLRIEETGNEMNRQGLSGLIASVNGLSTAIHALISDQRRDRP